MNAVKAVGAAKSGDLKVLPAPIVECSLGKPVSLICFKLKLKGRGLYLKGLKGLSGHVGISATEEGSLLQAQPLVAGGSGSLPGITIRPGRPGLDLSLCVRLWCSELRNGVRRCAFTPSCTKE